ncbi:MAG: hypothetical protein SO170_04340 [Butyribacter sp.]|nr:hypothetical protein [bacterium]MDY3854177.1 hypothetical protein [Butyribacter sp.]
MTEYYDEVIIIKSRKMQKENEADRYPLPDKLVRWIVIITSFYFFENRKERKNWKAGQKKRQKKEQKQGDFNKS